MATSERSVLCGANAYTQKYFYNEKEYGNIPKKVKDELHILCVLYTEEIGGIFTIVFEPDGSVSLDIQSDPSDFYYDEVSAGLFLSKIRQHRKELLESLSLYYRAFVLKETDDIPTGEEGGESGEEDGDARSNSNEKDGNIRADSGEEDGDVGADSNEDSEDTGSDSGEA